MPLPRPSRPDPLRPTAAGALAAWAARVRADREQVERLRELDDPADYYAPMADRFRADPHRTDDQVVAALSAIARPRDVWLDIGAGGGRYAELYRTQFEQPSMDGRGHSSVDLDLVTRDGRRASHGGLLVEERE